MPTPEEKAAVLAQYEEFVAETLKPDLQKSLERTQKIADDIRELQSLKNNLDELMQKQAEDPVLFNAEMCIFLFRLDPAVVQIVCVPPRITIIFMIF